MVPSVRSPQSPEMAGVICWAACTPCRGHSVPCHLQGTQAFFWQCRPASHRHEMDEGKGFLAISMCRKPPSHSRGRIGRETLILALETDRKCSWQRVLGISLVGTAYQVALVESNRE